MMRLKQVKNTGKLEGHYESIKFLVVYERTMCKKTAVTCGYAAASPASPHQRSVISCRLQDPPHILKRRRRFALRGIRKGEECFSGALATSK